ncbi:MAG TPA: amino acid permease [Gammaproteobacteria bacterium]|jgi:APA family basic amino acid/polyamine antiporter|nr:amino acid permease [Gammaproteobacteria bacterium]
MSILTLLSRRKSVEQLQQEAGESRQFRRVLGLWQLTAIGLGGIIGVGIFVLTGVVAATQAGPAVTLAFIMAGIASAAAALCYAEFSGMIPVTGSAYTYGYAVLGEFAAWLLGWDLLLCYALIVAVVAAGWSGYVQALLGAAGISLPAWAQGAAGSGSGHVFDVIAALAALAIAFLLTVRTEWGARFNTAIVAVKIAGILLVIIVGVFYIKPEHWHPFMPFGFSGVLSGAAVVFFAVFGYDTLTTAAEEAKDPQRDLPWAVVLSFAIAMLLYLAMSLVLTGMVPSASLNNPAPVANAFSAIGLRWVMVTVSIAAIMGITSVLFANMLAGARIGFALARDGLIPGWFAGVHPRFRTPYRATLILGVVTAVSAGLFPLTTVAQLANVGVLSAFFVICGAVILLRRNRPELKRSFRVPWVPILPVVGMGFCGWLIYGLPVSTDVGFLAWIGLGVLLYFAYGLSHSRLA